MKKNFVTWICIIVLFCSILFNFVLFSCNRKCLAKLERNRETITDTLFITYIDTIKLEIYNDSIRDLKFDLQSARDSIRFYRDKIDISYDCYNNARRVEKSKYYISICEKNESQKKYFFGWIKRTMSE